MRLRLILAAMLGLSAPMTGAAAAGGIVSLNVCADQYLLTMAGREPIRSLSLFAADRTLSWQAAAADGVVRNAGHGETILLDPPALVIAGQHDPRAKLELLSAKSIPVAAIVPWRSVAHGRDHIRTISAAIGDARAGEALIARIDAALDRARGAAARPATVIRLHRRGYVAPGDNLMADIIAATGLSDLGARAGFSGGVLPVERILALRPDYLIMNGQDAAVADQGAALLAHPALERLYPPEKRIIVPAILSVCEGPSTPALIDAVAHAVRNTVR